MSIKDEILTKCTSTDFKVKRDQLKKGQLRMRTRKK